MSFRDPTMVFFGQGPSTDSGRRFASIQLPGLAEAPGESTREGTFERHWLRTLAHVLVDEIHELHSVEKTLVEKLPPVALAATEPILRNLAQIHAQQTNEHRRRVELIFEMLGQSPDHRICLEMEGLLIGLQEIIAENRPGRTRDLALLTVTLKIKMRKVAGYCNARDYAQLLGLAPVATLLQQSLEEETALQERLSKLDQLLANQTITMHIVH